MVTSQEISGAIRELGLSGLPLCIHSSFRSFGGVEGGPTAVVEAFLSQGCTVMTPTFSSSFAVPPPKGRHTERNGWEYEKYKGPKSGIGRIYTPHSNEIDEDEMGVIPATILKMSDRARGNHPLISFTAIGPKAYELIAGQTASNPFAPLMVLAEMNGSVLLIGVDLSCMTLLHLAEERAGRNMFIRWANSIDGQVIDTKTGGCSNGFINFSCILSPIERDMRISSSTWSVYSAKKVLEVATEAIQQNPKLTHCNNPDCVRCNDAVMGGPLLA